MQPVLRFVEHNRLRPVYNIVRHFPAAVRRQAMHKDSILRGFFHERHVDLIGLQEFDTFCGVFLAHRDPNVGDDTISSLDRFVGVFENDDFAAFGLSPVDQVERGAKTSGRGDMQGKAETNGGMNPKTRRHCCHRRST